MYKKILVATDGSPLSKKAMVHATQLALLVGSELIILKVIPRVVQSYFDGAIPLNQKEIDKIEAAWAKDAHKLVDAERNTAIKAGINASSMVVKSDIVSKAIIDVSTKKKIDLIVMASHGRRGLKKLLLGSETQNVLVQSAIPVLVLR
ncbi:MAG: universal stress protein [Betaproteobacteria bacterium]|jgi:nucleotide-binding universal stress UspA family protein